MPFSKPILFFIAIFKQNIWVWLCLFHFGILHGQEILFSKVNTGNGLSDNLVYDASMDKNGVVWIATASGLNAYNGYEVSNWSEAVYPSIKTRDIRAVYADKANNLWVFGANGLGCFLDKNRAPHPIQFQQKKDSAAVRFHFPAANNDMYLLVKNNLLKINNGSTKATFVAALPDSLLKSTYIQETPAGNDFYLLTGSSKVLLIDLKNGRVVRHWKMPKALCAIMLRNGDVLVSTGNNRELFQLDTATGSIKKNHATAVDQHGGPINGYLRNMAMQADGNIAISSGYGGVYIFNTADETLKRFAHDPLNDQTVSANNTYKVTAAENGFVFITTRSSGLNMYNIHHKAATTISKFRDVLGLRIFDGFVGPVTSDNKQHIWMGSQGGLMEWDRKSNNVRFHEYGIIDGESIAGKEEVRVVHFDKQQRLWLGLNRYGVVLMDKQHRVLKYYNKSAGNIAEYLPSNFISDIEEAPDGYLWVATTAGLRIIHPKTLQIDTGKLSSELSIFKRKHINQIWFRSASEVWITTTVGVWQYNMVTKQIIAFNTKNGLVSNLVFCIAGDSIGNVYVGGRSGVDKIDRSGKITHFGSGSGLPNEACMSMQADRDGNVWIAISNYMVCYQPNTSRFITFDHSDGFSGIGFRLLSRYQKEDGEMFYGCNEGISFFEPALLLQSKQFAHVFVSQIIAGDTSIFFTTNDSVALPSQRSALSFVVNRVALSGSKDLQVEYMLAGQDTGWRKYQPSALISYPPLPSGRYIFKLRYKKNGTDWIEGANNLAISIQPIWWKQWWVMVLAGAFLLALLFYFFRNIYFAKKQLKEDAETEKAVLLLTSSMNNQTNLDDILWDVTSNCISKLKFEDCVIYLFDDERKYLHQKAAWGPKTTHDNRILNPIVIPVGSGIVGFIAQTGLAEIIADTTLDKRYIVDDQQRLSEICVPIMSEGTVMGVIDSEHSKNNFFTHRHLAILNTIASVLGSKMASMKAEAEKRKAEMALIENKQRTSEVEMKALRAQMNPHFMFNSLNSINNFILKNDADNASAYLTRFARLMRSILDNSRLEWVSLDNELKALQLYIEMESLRFDNVFKYSIQVAPNVDAMSVLLPPMIIQPYVENAIWHGLLHRKDVGSELKIGVSLHTDVLRICIDDNGIGRKAAAGMKSKFGTHKQSHGMQITAERLQIVNEVYDIDARAEIEDRTDAMGKATGTRVVLTMKCKRNESSNY